MIHEIRTYDLKPRTVDQFGENTKNKLGKRLQYSSLGGFWYTDIGPLNQVVHIWPYEDTNQRSEVRAKAVTDGIWPPDNSDLILNMRSDIMIPASFMKPLEPKTLGPIYEMRIYTYKSTDIPCVLDAWSDAIEEREKYSPLVGCWFSDIGDLNRLVHMWAYKSLQERSEIRSRTVRESVWPPKSGITAITQENKILLPFGFSPLQ
jgi:hypothetical protein